MSAQDWYARKLGQASFRAVAAPIPAYKPFQGAPVFDFTRQQQRVDPPQEMPPPPGSVNVHNFVEMAGKWKGGAAHKLERNPCPECGSPHFFSRSQGNSRMPPPAPHCFSCGYSGLFTQAEPATWGAA